MVGDGGIVLHSPGNGAWAIARKGDDVMQMYPPSYNAVWGSGANDIYAVGNLSGMSPGGQIVHSTDGTNWTPLAGNFPLLWTVWGVSAKNVYAAGASGAILHGM